MRRFTTNFWALVQVVLTVVLCGLLRPPRRIVAVVARADQPQ